MMTMCCPASGVLPRSPCTPCPTQRPCLPQSGKARPFCTKMVNSRSRFGTSRPEINSTSTPKYVIVTGCGIRAAGARSRSTASASGASGTAGRRRMPTPARLDQPGERRRRPRDQRVAGAAQRHPVVGDQRRPAADQRQRQRRLARARRRRESAPRGRRSPPPRRAASAIRPLHAIAAPAPFPSAQCERNRTPIPTGCDTRRPDFARSAYRINPISRTKRACSRVIQHESARMLRCGKRRDASAGPPVAAAGRGGQARHERRCSRCRTRSIRG